MDFCYSRRQQSITVFIIDAGFNILTIPKDVKYDISRKDDDIILQYYLDNNEGKEWATSASLTIILSDKGEILSKVPNYSSKEEYISAHKIEVTAESVWYGFFSCIIILVVFGIGCVIATLISKINKERDKRE